MRSLLEMPRKKAQKKKKIHTKKPPRQEWPGERPVLFRPDRLKYVRKIDQPKDCVFCAALMAGPSPESLLLYANEHAMVVMNKFPYNTGHLMVLPRRHCGDFVGLSQKEHHALTDLLRHVVQALGEIYKPGGMNIGLNLGSVAGAGIPEHLHYHVVPRWAGDTNFFPLIAKTKIVVETLEQTFSRLLPYFSKI